MKKYLQAASVIGLCLGFSISPSQAQNIDYSSMEMLFGEPVTTSATGKPQRKSDAPVGMEIITHEDIEKSGMTTIPDVLRRYAGIDVVQSTVGQHDVGIRGYNQFYSPRLLVLINGRQVYMDHFAYTAWSALPISMDDIRQIELVKGPNAALFGFNAVSGVINIITFHPLSDDRNRVSVRAGTQSHIEGSTVSTLKYKDKFGARVSMTGFESDSFDTDGQTANEIARGFRRGPKKRAANVDAVWQATDNTQVGVEVSHTVLNETEMYPILTMGRADYEVNSVKGSVASETGIGLVEVTAYHNVLDVNYGNLQNMGGNPDFNVDTTVIKVQDLVKPNANHTFRLGAEYRHNQSTTTPVEGGEVAYDVWSASGMWDWQATDSISWTNAVRVDHLLLDRSGTLDPQGVTSLTNADWSREITDVSYNSGLVWRVDDTTTFNASMGRGMQVPSLLEWGAFQGNGFIPAPFNVFTYLGGDPALDPTVVRNYELGLLHDLPDWELGDHQVTSEMEGRVFFQTSDDVKVMTGLLEATNGLEYLSANIGDSKTYGMEFGLKGTFGNNVYWGGNYTFQEVIDNLDNGPPSTNPYGADQKARINFEDTTLEHILNFYGGYQGEKFMFDTHLQYVSDRQFLRGTDPTAVFGPPFDPQSITLQDIDDNLNVSARLGYKITDDLTVSVSGTKLTKSETEESSAPDVERRAFVTLTWDY